MKKLALIAVLLISPAFANEVPQPAPETVIVPSPNPAPTPATAPPTALPPSAAAPAASPQPTAWNIEGLDAGDLATLNEALESLPMRVYRQFTVRLQQKIKPVR